MFPMKNSSVRMEGCVTLPVPRIYLGQSHRLPLIALLLLAARRKGETGAWAACSGRAPRALCRWIWADALSGLQAPAPADSSSGVAAASKDASLRELDSPIRHGLGKRAN